MRDWGKVAGEPMVCLDPETYGVPHGGIVSYMDV